MAKAGSLPFSFTMAGYVTNHRGGWGWGGVVTYLLKYTFFSSPHVMKHVWEHVCACMCISLFYVSL